MRCQTHSETRIFLRGAVNLDAVRLCSLHLFGDLESEHGEFRQVVRLMDVGHRLSHLALIVLLLRSVPVLL